MRISRNNNVHEVFIPAYLQHIIQVTTHNKELVYSVINKGIIKDAKINEAIIK